MTAWLSFLMIVVFSLFVGGVMSVVDRRWDFRLDREYQDFAPQWWKFIYVDEGELDEGV